VLFRIEANQLVVKLPDGGIDPSVLARPLEELGLPEPSAVASIRLEMPRDRKWGIVEAAFLANLAQRLERPGHTVPIRGLPRDLESLLKLVKGKAAEGDAVTLGQEGLTARLGVRAADWARDAKAFLTLLGEIVLLLPRFLAGRAKVRRSEMVEVLAESSTRALLIVGIVNLLMGAILAFAGAVQLKTFGAGLYVADLVGIAMVRELAPVMTAIVLAGRTGASFAAEIATMQGNEEIDALTALGVPPVEFLVLPRVLALTLAMPLLYVYACAVGLLGGLVVSTLMLQLSVTAYAVQTQDAINASNFVLGGLKALVFGALVALIGCHRGLRAGRSSADVGAATTAAVVHSIVAIIVVDAIFAVCANAVGI
jgi:phospholipid/cholesterol/gamma-HCH transport system permease protein